MTDDLVVEVDHLTKIYNDFWGRAKKKAVDDLSFSLKAGEVLGVIGPNGAGKTTTIKVLLGLLKPTRGTVKVFGQDPRRLDVKARLGFLPEESYLYRFLTPKETLFFFGKLFGIKKKILKDRVPQLLQSVGLSHVADKPIREFSKGMTRRLGLAQALVNDPELLILDEPTSGLDPVGTRDVKQLIQEQKNAGKSVLVSSHLLADLEDVCDRIAMLYEGELCLMDSVDQLLKEQDKLMILCDRVDDQTQSLWEKYLIEQGACDLKVMRPKKTLEKLFLETLAHRQSHS